MSLDGGGLAAALRLTRTRDGLLAIVDQVERRSRAALEGAFADADLANPDHVVLLNLERLRWPPAVAAHVEVLRACLSIREAPDDMPSLRDWLLLAFDSTHPDRVLGARQRVALKANASKPRQGIVSAIADRLASRRDALGDPLSPLELWPELVSALDRDSREPVENGHTKAEHMEVVYDDRDGQRKTLTMGTWRATLQRVRRKSPP